MEEARRHIARALQLDPELRTSNLRDRLVGLFMKKPEGLEAFLDGLRKAGLPE